MKREAGNTVKEADNPEITHEIAFKSTGDISREKSHQEASPLKSHQMWEMKNIKVCCKTILL